MTAEQIRRDELQGWLDGIAAFNATPGEGITRHNSGNNKRR